MPPPMTIPRPASPRPASTAILLLAVTLLLGACGATDPPASREPASTTPTARPSPTPLVTPVPTASPVPTPRFTNQPDPELAALLPTEAAGLPVIVAPFDEFALTPGDVAVAYGDIGLRFASLAVAYVEQPRTTLYAMRVDGDPVTTDDLEPHLATAGRYVGIAGLDPEPWQRSTAGGHVVWVRPEDNATALGTMIYTWASGDLVFLLIGVDDTLNREIVAALPGEAAPTPTVVPTASPSGGGGSSGASPSASP
jgi:hypothetical protein